MSLRPVLLALTFGGVGGFLYWKIGPEDPGRITGELRAIYDRQEAGWESKDLDEIFTHVDPKALYTALDGSQQATDDSKIAIGNILAHGDDFRENWTITGMNVSGDTVTVLLRFHNEYTMRDCSWNSARGVRESFQEDGTCVDVWKRELGEWREVSSTSKSFHRKRNGVPFKLTAHA